LRDFDRATKFATGEIKCARRIDTIDTRTISYGAEGWGFKSLWAHDFLLVSVVPVKSHHRFLGLWIILLSPSYWYRLNLSTAPEVILSAVVSFRGIDTGFTGFGTISVLSPGSGRI
jgi:hypothetical protein